MKREEAVEKLIVAAQAWRDTRRGKEASYISTASPDCLQQLPTVFEAEDEAAKCFLLCSEEHNLAVAIDNLTVAE
jgi:hypothetical protein